MKKSSIQKYLKRAEGDLLRSRKKLELMNRSEPGLAELLAAVEQLYNAVSLIAESVEGKK